MRQPGNYVGNLASFAFTQSSKKATEQLELDFNLTNNGEETGETVTVTLFLTEKCLAPGEDGEEGISTRALNALGFNWKFDAPEFTNSTGVGLWMKHEDYTSSKGETKTGERWSISSRVRTPLGMDRLKRLNQTARAIVGAKPPVPAGKPAVPARSAPPKSAPPPTEDDAPADVWTRDRAWDAWCAACEEQQKGSMPDSAHWKKCIAERAADVKRKESAFTSEDWQHIAGQCPPF